MLFLVAQLSLVTHRQTCRAQIPDLSWTFSEKREEAEMTLEEDIPGLKPETKEFVSDCQTSTRKTRTQCVEATCTFVCSCWKTIKDIREMIFVST